MGKFIFRMRALKKNHLPLEIFLIVCCLSSACNNDTPISARLDLIDPNDRGQIVPQLTRSATADSTDFSTINTAGSPYLLLGTFDNVESRILIRFAPLSDTGRVVAATLKLPTHLVMTKGSAESFEATVHEVTNAWEEAKVTWDNFADAFIPTPRGVQTITAINADTTDVDTVVFALDADLVASWRDSSRAQKGILIQARQSTFLKEFHSRNSILKNPSLELVTFKDGNNDTTSYRATASVFIFKRSVELPKGPLYVGHGEKHQSVFFFDLDSIPENVTINRAMLTLEVDASNSVIGSDDVSASLYRILQDIKLSPLKPDSLETPADTVQFLQQISVSSSSTSITINVTSLVQVWVVEPSGNFGVALLPNTPYRDISRVAFYSTETSASRAPKLQIDYTRPPGVP
jgi:hypothetical protein